MSKSKSEKFEALRRKAEELVGPVSETRVELPHYELARLVHELEVHQVELETQNEELLNAQRELERERERFADLYDQAPVAYFTLDRKGRIEEVNLTGARMLGVEREAVIGAHLSKFLPPDGADQLYLHLQRVMDTHEPDAVELALRPEGKPAFKTRFDSITVDRQNGPAQKCRTVVSDISREARAEQANVLQAKAIANLAEGVLITESEPGWPDGTIIFANDGMSRITGYSIDELTGQAPRLFHGPKTDSRVRAHVRERLKEGLSVRAEVVNHRKDGRPFEAELYVAPVREDGEDVTHLVAIYSDISGRRQLSRELLERQSRLRAVLDTAVESIITINENGVIQDFNPAAERLFAYQAEEIIGRNVNVLMPSPYREEHDGYLEAYLKTGERKIIGIGREVEAQRRDGSVFPIDLSVSEFQVGGRPMFTGIIRDISERKAHEREAQVWAEELERRVEEGTRELRLANQELRELNYFISHDLRAPLRAVRNYVDFLAEDLEGKVQGSTAEDLRHLQQANREMQAMVEDLLAYSRLSQGKTLTPAEIDVRSLIESIGSQLKGRSNHEVVAEGELPRLNAPEVLVRQVFQNLVENGLKYNESETPEVRIAATRLGGEPVTWEFTFRDNGIGIDGKHHEEIFRMFRRLHTSEHYVGTGIGLAGVNKAAQLLGGSVRLESTPGQGSTFYVELPERSGGG